MNHIFKTSFVTVTAVMLCKLCFLDIYLKFFRLIFGEPYHKFCSYLCGTNEAFRKKFVVISLLVLYIKYCLDFFLLVWNLSDFSLKNCLPVLSLIQLTYISKCNDLVLKSTCKLLPSDMIGELFHAVFDPL